MTNKVADVAVIGGGPAGAISALTLAQRGRSVVLLEKEQFPRFRIGESLLPYMAGLLERLGIWDALDAQGYVDKFGAEFIDPSATKFLSGVWRADFSRQGEGRHSRTFQVKRAHFDRVLLEQAEAAGRVSSREPM
jgi:FADH2-dependent halogenase